VTDKRKTNKKEKDSIYSQSVKSTIEKEKASASLMKKGTKA